MKANWVLRQPWNSKYLTPVGDYRSNTNLSTIKVKHTLFMKYAAEFRIFDNTWRTVEDICGQLNLNHHIEQR